MKLVTAWLASSQEYFQHLGWVGMLAFIGAIAIAGTAGLPLSPFAVSAGMIFGFARGLLVVQIGTTASAAINFLIARHFARDFVQRRVAGNAKFQAVDAAVGREGWKIVAMLRFVPLPFSLLNYFLGLTAISFWPYVLATTTPILLSNSFLVWLGLTANAGLEAATGAGRQRHPLEIGMMVLGVLAALAALTFVTRIARQAIAQRDETLG